jgi:hypothetical protein
MAEVTGGEQRSSIRWGITFGLNEDPYETYDTYEAALAAFDSMKLKHQMNEYIVRIDTTYTEVYNGDHISWDDAYGDNSARAAIIEMVNKANTGRG